MSPWWRLRTQPTQDLAQPTRMCSLVVGDAVLLRWGLVRIVLRAANVARDFFVWPSGIHLYRGTARHFRGEPIVSSKFQGRKLSRLHVRCDSEEVGSSKD